MYESFLLSLTLKLPTIKGVEEQSEPKLEHKHDSEHKHDHVHEHADVHALITLKERHVSTYILELGVASHSIIIGNFLLIHFLTFRHYTRCYKRRRF